MKFLSFLALILFANGASASQEISDRLRSEFERLHRIASTTEPEFMVGGLLHGKNFGDHELLWRLADEPGEYDVIRIYRDKGRYDSLDISFYRARHIVPGRNVIRRFVGPGISGWRNDTMDADTGEYLGSQGNRRPPLDSRDREILEQWDIQLFE